MPLQTLRSLARRFQELCAGIGTEPLPDPRGSARRIIADTTEHLSMVRAAQSVEKRVAIQIYLAREAVACETLLENEREFSSENGEPKRVCRSAVTMLRSRYNAAQELLDECTEGSLVPHILAEISRLESCTLYDLKPDRLAGVVADRSLLEAVVYQLRAAA